MCTVILTVHVQPLPRQPTRPACLPLQNDTRPEDELWDFGTIFHTRCGRPEGWIIRRLPPFSLHSIFLSLTSACSHLHLLFLSPYFICSLPSPSSSVLAAKYTYALSTLRERDIDSRGRTVLWLYCKIPRIHGSKTGNTEDWFLHSTHHKKWIYFTFLCMCLVMLVISRYALPLFFFLYWQNFSFTASFSVHYLIPGLNRRDTRLLCGGTALPLVDSFDVLVYRVCAFRAGWYFLTDI